MNIKRSVSIIITLIILVNTFSAFTVCSAENFTYIPENITTYSRGVYMVNLDTETVVYSKSADRRMYPASLTKIMTAAVVLEKCGDPAEEKVLVPVNTNMFDEIYKVGGSNIALKEGELMTVKDLLYALILPSACDAASVLAYHFGGGNIDTFVEDMNKTAKELGCENTNFENAHGLQSDDHYSSPKDMYLILKHAMKYPLFMEIISQTKYTIPETNKSKARTVRYTIEMLNESSDDYYEYMKGIKTGFTGKAGRCLSSMATKDGATYCIILFGANLDQPPVSTTQKNLCYDDTRHLYDYMFDNYEVKEVISPETAAAEIPVVNGLKDTVSLYPSEGVTAVVPKNSELTFKVNAPDSFNAPVLKGESGEISVFCDDILIASASLLVTEDVYSASVKDPETGNRDNDMTEQKIPVSIEDLSRLFENQTFLALILVLIVFLILFISVIIISKRKGRRG